MSLDRWMVSDTMRQVRLCEVSWSQQASAVRANGGEGCWPHKGIMLGITDCGAESQ